jgi:undecaprenyl-diphosphatase
VRAVSRCGEHGIAWYAIAAAGAALDPGRRPLYARAARTVLLSFALNQLVKLAVRRPRPELDGMPPLIPTWSQRSYPSAHATTSFAAARALSGALPAGPLHAAAAAMALTRPYLGVHYPSDTLAGAALGAAAARLVP